MRTRSTSREPQLSSASQAADEQTSRETSQGTTKRALPVSKPGPLAPAARSGRTQGLQPVPEDAAVAAVSDDGGASGGSSSSSSSSSSRRWGMITHSKRRRLHTLCAGQPSVLLILLPTRDQISAVLQVPQAAGRTTPVRKRASSCWSPR